MFSLHSLFTDRFANSFLYVFLIRYHPVIIFWRTSVSLNEETDADLDLYASWPPGGSSGALKLLRRRVGGGGRKRNWRTWRYVQLFIKAALLPSECLKSQGNTLASLCIEQVSDSLTFLHVFGRVLMWCRVTNYTDRTSPGTASMPFREPSSGGACDKMQQNGVAGLQQLWESWSCRLNDLQDDPKVPWPPLLPQTLRF